MSDKNRPCLIGQTNCGRELGNPVCPWCGIDERVVYPSQADLEEALAQAKADYQRRPDPRPSAQPCLTESQVFVLYLKVESDETARKTLIFEAECGNMYAQHLLGWMYSRGLGIAQNDEQAFAWIHKAAEQGHYLAQYNLGKMYSKGRCIAQNDEQAFAWIHKAAERGDSQIQYDLGLMYEKGQGVAKNNKQAAAWYQKSAAKGYAPAQEKLNWKNRLRRLVKA